GFAFARHDAQLLERPAPSAVALAASELQRELREFAVERQVEPVCVAAAVHDELKGAELLSAQAQFVGIDRDLAGLGTVGAAAQTQAACAVLAVGEALAVDVCDEGRAFGRSADDEAPGEPTARARQQVLQLQRGQIQRRLDALPPLPAAVQARVADAQ